MEQNTLAEQYNWNLNWHDSGNETAALTEVPTFHCPSVPDRRGFEWAVLLRYANATTTSITTTPRNFYYGATTDYANVGGISTQLNSSLPANQRLSDPLNCGVLKSKAVKLSDIMDGLSNTILLVECAGRPELLQNGRLVPDGATPKTWSGTSSVTRPFPTGGVWASHNKGFIIDGAQPNGNTAIRPGPCSVNCSNDNEVYSFHVGGAHVLMTDGSVTFISASLPVVQLAALVSRSGREVVSLP